jgi:hypothetical protein
MTRLRCLACQDGRHRHHTDYPQGMILAPCHCLDCDSQPSPEAKLKVRAPGEVSENAERSGRPVNAAYLAG